MGPAWSLASPLLAVIRKTLGGEAPVLDSMYVGNTYRYFSVHAGERKSRVGEKLGDNFWV